MKNLFLLLVFCLVLEGAVANKHDYLNVTLVQDTFMATFVHTTPLKDYVIGVSVSTLDAQKAFHDVTLSYDEAWTDLCLDIMLGAPLPELLKELLPPTFLDLRVFYRVTAKEDAVPDGVVCPMSMEICPDGTFVAYTVVDGKCSLVCPTATGNISFSQMSTIQKDFEDEYMSTAPYSDFINGVAITTLHIMNSTHNITLGANERWIDFCLTVSLIKEPEAGSDVKLPSLYKGARVFYHVGHYIIVHGSVIQMSSIVVPFAVFLCGIFMIVGCCMRKRKCKQACKARASLLKTPEEPVAAPQMMPADFSVEMYPPQYEYDYGVQYDFQGQQQQEPVMMVPSGYPHPVFVPQHGWFLPIPQQEQQQQEQ